MNGSWRGSAKGHLLALRDRLEKSSFNFEDKKALRKEVKDAYPFGEREYTPYKIWCEEVKKMFPGLYPQRTHPVNEQGVPLFQ